MMSVLKSFFKLGTSTMEPWHLIEDLDQETGREMHVCLGEGQGS